MADAKSQQAGSQPGAGALEAHELEGLLRKEFRPKSDEQNEMVTRAVQTLAEQALAQTQLIGSDVVASISAMIAQIEK